MGWSWRRACACLGVVGVLGLGVLPPEHVHFVADHDHEPAELVHRHFEPHHTTSLQAHVESPEAATYLSGVFIVPAQEAPIAPGAFVVVAVTPEPITRNCTHWRGSGRDLRVHDPPWARCHPLRGPPFLLA
jgi:hypothetical protein